MGTRVALERMESYTQVIEVLKHMDKRYVEKVPLKLRNFFADNCSREYKFEVNPNISLKEHKLKEKTLDILAMLNINFWCETEEHKKALISIYSENERKYQQELSERYSMSNIFKNTSKESAETNQEVAMVEVIEEPIYKRIFNKIKEFFSKNKMN